MISKAEMLRNLKDIIVSDEYAIPLYLGHLLQTLPWYGLPADLERTAKDVLDKIRIETESSRLGTERIYLAIQETRNEEF